MRQFKGVNKEKGIFFASHKLACHLVKDFLKKAQIWILDEEPHNLIEVVKCPLDGLLTLRAVFPEDSDTVHLAQAVLKLGGELHKATNGKKQVEGRIYIRSVGFGPWANKKTLIDLLGIDLTETAPVIRSEIEQVLKNYRKSTLFRKGVNLKSLKWIQEVMGQGNAYLLARRDPEKPLELKRVLNPVPEKWCGRLIVLDATAFPPVVERVLRRPGMQLLDIRVPVEVQTAWFKRSVSKTAITNSKGQKTAIKALKQALKEIKAEKVAIFCHQAIKAEIEEAVAHDGRKIVVTHHFGTEAKGTNRFADFEAVILLGLPIVNPGTYYDTALALGLNGEEWETWLDLLVRAEAWQEIHRIRPILCPDKQVLVIAPRWPFKEWLGEPKQVMEPEEIKGDLDLSSKILQIWLEIFRFVYIEIALLLGIGRPGQISSTRVRAEIWRRIKEAYPRGIELFFTKVELLYRASDTPFKNPSPSQIFPEQGSSRACQKPYKIYIKGPNTPFAWECLGSSRACHLPLREITFKDPSWWRQVFRRLREARPDLPVFEVQIQTKGGLQRTRGLGNIEAAKAFCRAVGLEVNENAWRYINVQSS